MITAARPAPRTPDCPACGARLELVTDGAIEKQFVERGVQLRHGKVATRIVQAPFLACPGCEFCVEVQL